MRYPTFRARMSEHRAVTAHGAATEIQQRQHARELADAQRQAELRQAEAAHQRRLADIAVIGSPGPQIGANEAKVVADLLKELRHDLQGPPGGGEP